MAEPAPGTPPVGCAYREYGRGRAATAGDESQPPAARRGIADESSRRRRVIDVVVAAIRDGGLAVIPTDTVYGLACDPDRPEAIRRLTEVKRRAPDQPIALVASSVDRLLECVPELRSGANAVA